MSEEETSELEEFVSWITKVHKDALIHCPSYGTYRFVERLNLLYRRWKKK